MRKTGKQIAISLLGRQSKPYTAKKRIEARPSRGRRTSSLRLQATTTRTMAHGQQQQHQRREAEGQDHCVERPPGSATPFRERSCCRERRRPPTGARETAGRQETTDAPGCRPQQEKGRPADRAPTAQKRRPPVPGGPNLPAHGRKSHCTPRAKAVRGGIEKRAGVLVSRASPPMTP